MKHTLFLIGMATLLLSACQNEAPVTISGTIANVRDEIVLLESTLSDQTDTLKLSNGDFSQEIDIEKAEFINIIINRTGLGLYAKPGDNITINMDLDQLKKNDLTKVEITGSPESELLLALRKKSSDLDIRGILAYAPAKFDAFLKDRLNEELGIIDSFKTTKSLSQEYLDMITLQTKITSYQIYDYYPIYHRQFAPGDTSAIPEEFANKGGEIPLDDMALYEGLSSYKFFVLNKYQKAITDNLGEFMDAYQSDEYVSKQIDEIAALDVDPLIKNDLGTQLLRSYSRFTDNQKAIADKRYAEILSEEKDVAEFEEKISQMNALKPGNSAPGFAYPDINGQVISSEDLKGKVIYMDIWATWCGPCKREIPYLKAMETELHDEAIAFVSISIDDDKEAWEKMVQDENLQGYQLYAKEAWKTKIVTDYMISGIPRFIIVDKEGKLVTPNATRPSDPNTKATLLEYANK